MTTHGLEAVPPARSRRLDDIEQRLAQLGSELQRTDLRVDDMLSLLKAQGEALVAQGEALKVQAMALEAHSRMLERRLGGAS